MENILLVEIALIALDFSRPFCDTSALNFVAFKRLVSVEHGGRRTIADVEPK